MYKYFWKVYDKYGFCSQWYISPFIEDGIKYETAEHYMMYNKAKLFDDQDAMKQILEERSPAKVKQIGRQIKNFSEEKWAEHREGIVMQGNYLKFIQNPELRKELLKEKFATFVEASPTDRVWGIGFTAATALKNKHLWGLNLLGKALTTIRDNFYKDSLANLSDETFSQSSHEAEPDSDDFSENSSENSLVSPTDDQPPAYIA